MDSTTLMTEEEEQRLSRVPVRELYDPDDSTMLACGDIPPNGTGTNTAFNCNPALLRSTSRDWRR